MRIIQKFDEKGRFIGCGSEPDSYDRGESSGGSRCRLRVKYDDRGRFVGTETVPNNGRSRKDK
jgi:hypothetical protein